MNFETRQLDRAALSGSVGKTPSGNMFAFGLGFMLRFLCERQFFISVIGGGTISIQCGAQNLIIFLL